MAKTVQDLDVQTKKHMKENRLEQYQRRYYDLLLDEAALMANGDLISLKELQDRMESLVIAYNAVDAVP